MNVELTRLRTRVVGWVEEVDPVAQLVAGRPGRQRRRVPQRDRAGRRQRLAQHVEHRVVAHHRDEPRRQPHDRPLGAQRRQLLVGVGGDAELTGLEVGGGDQQRVPSVSR
ncbi:MAG: hypothetical protein R2726_17110 [Acidimicrobiales bacterium]